MEAILGTTKAPRKAKLRPTKAKAVTAGPSRSELKAWATGGVIGMALLSALLNGYANALHSTVSWAGWAMGLAVPAIVLVLGKVAGLAYKAGLNKLAYGIGLTGSGLLFLSVLHCAESIALLTGSGQLLAAPMAIAIDVGLVGCELAALLSE